MEVAIWLVNTRCEARRKVSYCKEEFSRRNFKVARKRNRMQSSVNTRVDQKYLAEGEAGLEVKKKPGNPLSRYERRNELTYEEQLQYQIELLKRELVKKEAEVLRLKKRNERKGGDARKR